MKSFIIPLMLLMQVFSGGWVLAQEPAGTFKKSGLYNAMQRDDEKLVNQQLALLKTASVKERAAYEGALLMKKAGIVGGPGKKLKLFKDGHKKLEAVLQKDSTNAEFRFLRLMIQEHAPGILGYKGEIQTDKLYIIHNYKKLPPEVQSAVADYSKKSKYLKPTDL